MRAWTQWWGSVTCTQHMLLQSASIKLTRDFCDAPVFLLRKERLVYSLKGVSHKIFLELLHSWYFLEFCFIIVLFQLSFDSLLWVFWNENGKKRKIRKFFVNHEHVENHMGSAISTHSAVYTLIGYGFCLIKCFIYTKNALHVWVWSGAYWS